LFPSLGKVLWPHEKVGMLNDTVWWTSYFVWFISKDTVSFAMVILGVWTSLFFCCLFLGCLDKCSVGIFFTCIYSSGVYTYIHIYIHTHTHTHTYMVYDIT
jgi:hypothetical protein